MAKTKGQARAARFLGLNCGTPPSTHERDSDFSDRFSECSDRSISGRFRGGIGEVFPVVKLKFAQAVEGTADEFDLIPPTRSAAEAMEAACDAAWPDTLLFAVSIGNLPISDVLPRSLKGTSLGRSSTSWVRGSAAGSQSCRAGPASLTAPLQHGCVCATTWRCGRALQVWMTGCKPKRPFGALVAKPLTCTDADRHSDLIANARNAWAGSKAAAAAAARKRPECGDRSDPGRAFAPRSAVKGGAAQAV